MQAYVAESEFECSYTKSSGPGGQNVNKVNSKCVLRWNPSKSASLSDAVKQRFIAKFAARLTHEGDLLITGDRFRDQKKNYQDCAHKLQTMVAEVLRPPKARKPTRPSRAAKKKRLDSKRVHSQKKASRSSSGLR